MASVKSLSAPARSPFGAQRHAAIVVEDGEIDAFIAAGVDQGRARRHSLLDRSAPFADAAPLVDGVLGVCGARDEQGRGQERQQSPKPGALQER